MEVGRRARAYVRLVDRSRDGGEPIDAGRYDAQNAPLFMPTLTTFSGSGSTMGAP